MTQNEKILAYLKSGVRITQAEAFQMFGVARLASRINDLRNMGVNIGRVLHHTKNRYGEPVKVAAYYLA